MPNPQMPTRPHPTIQAYKEAADSWLQTCSMLGIFLSLWLGLIIKVGIVDELDLPGNPIASSMYEGLTALVNMLPLVAALVAIGSKVGGVCSKLPVWGLCPDMGCVPLVKMLTGGGSVAAQQQNALSLALALNTDVAGEALRRGASQRVKAKAKAREEKLLLQEQKTKETITEIRNGSPPLVRSSGASAQGRAREEALREDAVEAARMALEVALAEEIEVQATRARAGDPFLGRDVRRRGFLLEMRISAEALVMRHYPIGKGFIVHLRADDADDGISEEEGRPPYLFVKIWRLSYELRTGFVKVQYDMRDVGFKVDPQQVAAHTTASGPCSKYRAFMSYTYTRIQCNN